MSAPRPFAFLVSTTGCARDIRGHMGSADYSYVFVLNAFRPVLERLGTIRLIDVPESQLALAAERAERAGFQPVHLAMQPPQSAYFTPAVPTVLFPFWEFPGIPDRDFGHDTRQNWRRMCRHASLIITACRFTAEAFRRAGVACPVEVVPVPLAAEPFQTLPWNPHHVWTLGCRHLVLGDHAPPTEAARSSKPPARFGPSTLRHALRDRYRRHVRPWLSAEAIEHLSRAQKAIFRLPETPTPLLPVAPLSISGLVYTTIFNFSDRRKNAADLLSAFLFAFRERPDVTLVLKLATSPSREFYELRELRELYDEMGVSHRCRVVVVTDFLSDEQMIELLRVTRYYVNTSHAEGACLPLQQALAAGRPALAPQHSAMADYIDDSVGFLIGSHPEPTFWPHDPEQRNETIWHRLVWSDLRAAFLRSAQVAEGSRQTYDLMSRSARARMAGYASQDVVAESLRSALRHVPEDTIGAHDWNTNRRPIAVTPR